MTSGSMQNYYNDVVNDDVNKNDSGNYRINNKITISKSFEYKAKITGSAPVDNGRLDTSWTTFGDLFDLPLINCEIEPICHGQKIV